MNILWNLQPPPLKLRISHDSLAWGLRILRSLFWQYASAADFIVLVGWNIIYSTLSLQLLSSTSLLWCFIRKRGKDGHLRAKGEAKHNPALTFALAVFHATIYMENATGWVHPPSLFWNCRDNLNQFSWLAVTEMQNLLPTQMLFVALSCPGDNLRAVLTNPSA